MQQHHRLGDAVERQGPGPEVQEHPHPAAAGGGDGHAVLVVLEGAGGVGAVQAPRLGVVAQLAVAPSPGPAHAFVADAHGNAPGASPLHLPVAAARHPGAAQHLGPAGESGLVLRVGLGLGARGHLPAAVGEAEVRVGRAVVQADVAGIWTDFTASAFRVWNSGKRAEGESNSHCRKSPLVFGSTSHERSGAAKAGQDAR